MRVYLARRTRRFIASGQTPANFLGDSDAPLRDANVQLIQSLASRLAATAGKGSRRQAGSTTLLKKWREVLRTLANRILNGESEYYIRTPSLRCKRLILIVGRRVLLEVPRSWGCELAQGFYFGHPLCAADAVTFTGPGEDAPRQIVERTPEAVTLS